MHYGDGYGMAQKKKKKIIENYTTILLGAVYTHTEWFIYSFFFDFVLVTR